MTSFGEEATHIGSAAGVTMDDIVYGQYREVGVLLWRGFSLDDIILLFKLLFCFYSHTIFSHIFSCY